MDNPSTSESRICVFTRELAKTLRYSPYRLTDETGKDGKHYPFSPLVLPHCPTKPLNSHVLTSRLVMIDMASYTDKYKQKRSLNALNLDAEALGMSKEFFPKAVWEMYFEGKDPEGESLGGWSV